MIEHSLHHVQRPGRPVGTILRPATVGAALLAMKNNPDARLLSGGSDLLLDLQRGGPGEPVTLIDLTGVHGFASVIDDDDYFELGAGITHAQIVADPSLAEHVPLLVQACAEIGSPQLRNRATLAGNLATASPANDSISALMALDAVVELRTALEHPGKMYVPVSEFFEGFRTTVMRPDQMITSIRVPKLRSNERGVWAKLGLRKAQAISVVHLGMVVGIEDGFVSSARLSMGSVAATVVMIPEFAEVLVGNALDGATIAATARAVAAAVAPIDDVRATAEYRTTVIEPLIVRSLQSLRDETSVVPADQPTLSGNALHRSANPKKSTIGDDDVIAMTVNGQEVTASGAASTTLLDWLRDHAVGPSSLTGTKEGCAEGECGACTVTLDGAAVMSCLVAAGQADEGTVVTIEGLAESDQLHDLQQAFVDCFAVQCGFCIPGFIMAGSTLLTEVGAPTDDQIDVALSGNLCRCTGYYPIRQAIRTTAEGRAT